MKSEKLTLTTGEEIEIFIPASKLYNLTWKKYPKVEPPIVEQQTASGSVIRVAMENDPDYLKAKSEAEEKRDALYQELYTLSALKNVRAPEDFDPENEFGFTFRYADPEWQPRKGEQGRTLDYIDYVLLANTKDFARVNDAINKLAGIDMEVVSDIEDSFRDQVEG